ncbi:response regulator transcription factor [Campylobacter mucosalis]|uniref:Two-component system response regulator n=2 Tax=Campylobacter mucosalis TaxID=202 RepID=A0A6G5QHC7_9BACT|nr:chemotaxis protein CheY [Campylobacter mucosalis]QCD45024.1 two-component system response regulator [Campylobacter mucosalis CCUG 21559]QKF62913.1 two-component system response regulator [Campylobacter mucosalis]
MKILLVEDDETLLEMTQEFLSENGYEVCIAKDVKSALDLSYEQKFDIFILDVKLPKGDGFSLLSSLREARINTPTIFTTSLNTLDDIECGYKSGCDDYLKKPYELKELLLRINTLLKRTFSHTNNDFIDIGNGYKFYTLGKILKKDDQIINLCNKEIELLLYFLQNKNTLLSKDEIFNKIYAFDEEPSELSLRAYIKNLRKILGKDSIVNRRGDGYIYL